VFIAVVEAGSYTRAAKTLGISQSTVSETVSSLERSVGVALFRKSPHASGRGPARVCAQDHRDDRRDRHGAREGIGRGERDARRRLVESIGAYVLPSPLAALRERWPNARLAVMSGTCPEIRERVATGECDLGAILEDEAGGAGDPIVTTSRFVIFGSPTSAASRWGPQRSASCGRTRSGASSPSDRSSSPGGPALPRLVMRAVRSPSDSRSPMVDELLETLRTTQLF
jgi:DNA-binding transcriptional LysR family regulator